MAQQFYSEETEMLDFRSMMIRAGGSCAEPSAQLCEMIDGSRVHAQLLFADEASGVITWAFRPVDKHSEKSGNTSFGRIRMDRILCSSISENPPFESSICWTTIFEDSESHRYASSKLCGTSPIFCIIIRQTTSICRSHLKSDLLAHFHKPQT